jgi:hypothetical protein
MTKEEALQAFLDKQSPNCYRHYRADGSPDDTDYRVAWDAAWEACCEESAVICPACGSELGLKELNRLVQNVQTREDIEKSGLRPEGM